MSEEFYTVEAVADRLKLHPKTVLRLIREGRLRAMKAGRQYRIIRSELDAFTGASRSAPPATPRLARVTAIVDIPDVDADFARRAAVLLTGARSGHLAHGDVLSADVAHDPARRHVKVIAVGQPADAAQLLGLVQALLES